MIVTVKRVFLGLGMVVCAHAHAQGNINHIVVQQEQQLPKSPQAPKPAKEAEKPRGSRALNDMRLNRHGAAAPVAKEKEKPDTFQRIWDKYEDIAAGLSVKEDENPEVEDANIQKPQAPEVVGAQTEDRPVPPKQLGAQSQGGGLKQIIASPQPVQQKNQESEE